MNTTSAISTWLLATTHLVQPRRDATRHSGTSRTRTTPTLMARSARRSRASTARLSVSKRWNKAPWRSSTTCLKLEARRRWSCPRAAPRPSRLRPTRSSSATAPRAARASASRATSRSARCAPSSAARTPAHVGMAQRCPSSSACRAAERTCSAPVGPFGRPLRRRRLQRLEWTVEGPCTAALDATLRKNVSAVRRRGEPWLASAATSSVCCFHS